MHETPMPSQPHPAARAQLQRRVAWYQVRGATIVYQDERTTVLSYRHRVDHKRHGVATLCTFGLWAPFWGLYTLTRRARKRGIVLMIDKYGLMHEERARRQRPGAGSARA